MGQGKKGFEPSGIIPPLFGDGFPVVRPADDRTDRNDQDVDQFMCFGPFHARIFQAAKVFFDAGRWIVFHF